MADLADLIRETLAKELADFTGECACAGAYTSRDLLDPLCAWHAAGGNLFLEDAAEAVAAVLSDGATVQWGTRLEGYPVRPSANELNARAMAEDGAVTAVSRKVLYGPWEAS